MLYLRSQCVFFLLLVCCHNKGAHDRGCCLCWCNELGQQLDVAWLCIMSCSLPVGGGCVADGAKEVVSSRLQEGLELLMQ